MKLIQSTQMKLYLFFTIFLMAILPLMGSFYLLDDVLEGTLNLGLNPQVGEILNASQQDLKELRKDHPEREENFKERFYTIQQHKQIFEDTKSLKLNLKYTYRTYYFIGVLLVSLFALASALILGGKISRSYGRLLLENQRKNKKLQELENFDQWKRMARKLAHEIKNPLTPIEMMVSALALSHERKDRESFKAQLLETKEVVGEEVENLKRLVQNFSSFARLPEPKKIPTEMQDYLKTFIEHFSTSWPDIEMEMRELNGEEYTDYQILLDRSLFRQVLTNIINNAREANLIHIQDVPLKLSFNLKKEKDDIYLQLINNGAPIPNPEDVFKLYFSTKSGKDNMGLGLPIAKKIVMDHGGEMTCMDLKEGAGFEIKLPLKEI